MPGLALTLVYDAPVECPAQEALRSAVENLVTSERTRPLSVRVTISKLGESYQASIDSAGGSPRVLRGSTCREVVEGTSVVLALAVTPQGLASNEQEAKEVRAAGAPRRSSALAARETNGIVGASARGDVGTLPHATLGFGGQVGLERSRWSAYVAGSYWMTAQGNLPSEPALGGKFSWWTGAAMGCGAPVTGAVLVLRGLARPLHAGDRVPLVLTIETANGARQSVSVNAEVRERPPTEDERRAPKR